MTPTADEGSVVRAVEPVPALVLGDPVGSAARALVLEPVDETSSRPGTRVRAAYERSAAAARSALARKTPSSIASSRLWRARRTRTRRGDWPRTSTATASSSPRRSSSARPRRCTPSTSTSTSRPTERRSSWPTPRSTPPTGRAETRRERLTPRTLCRGIALKTAKRPRRKGGAAVRVSGRVALVGAVGSLSAGPDVERVEVVGEDRPAGPDRLAVRARRAAAVLPVAAFEVADSSLGSGAVALQAALGASESGCWRAGMNTRSRGVGRRYFLAASK
jgi:hypothetical protein